ncbi:uncharacterized protein LOC131327702 [Rhododendron vialii]|uniref:uncharacterized protein LOC131327702 n=1 Tax=Rhododendron vialii TaxID=182163 RepID=UPI00265E321F|nr:uncharacterized protein LOC131327702 [Rhododendron vialii]
MGHYKRECPQPQRERNGNFGGQRAQQTGQTGFGKQNPVGPSQQLNGQKNKGKQPMGTQQSTGGRIFALQIDTCVQALFDSGASHSFISFACVTALALETEPLSTSMKVTSPLGGSIAVNLVCRGCKIKIANLRLTCDLRVINIADFDIILGMDWLSAHRAVIDCHQKTVTTHTSEGTRFRFKGDRQTTSSTTKRSRWQNQLFG